MNDAELRDLFASDEMKAALRQRIIDGTAKKHEIDLARTLGIAISEEDRAREYMRAVPPDARQRLLDLIAVSQSKASTTLRLVRAGAWIGVVMPTTVDANRLRFNPDEYGPAGSNTEPSTASTETDPDDLRPPKRSTS